MSPREELDEQIDHLRRLREELSHEELNSIIERLERIRDKLGQNDTSARDLKEAAGTGKERVERYKGKASSPGTLLEQPEEDEDNSPSERQTGHSES